MEVLVNQQDILGLNIPMNNVSLMLGTVSFWVGKPGRGKG